MNKTVYEWEEDESNPLFQIGTKHSLFFHGKPSELWYKRYAGTPYARKQEESYEEPTNKIAVDPGADGWSIFVYPATSAVSSGNDHGDQSASSRRIREAGMGSDEDLCGET
jgi:hypothetical protein